MWSVTRQVHSPDSPQQPLTKRSKISKMKDRTSNAVGLALNQSKLDDAIENLTSSINRFRRLRKTIKELQECNAATKAICVRQNVSVPDTYTLIAKHSSSFLDMFVRNWSCRNLSGIHSRHLAKFFLDNSASDDCVNFKMVLEYEAKIGGSTQRYKYPLNVTRIFKANVTIQWHFVVKSPI